MVTVRVEFVFSGIVAGAKTLAIVGGWVTVRVAVLDVVPVPPFVELTAPVVLAYEPGVAESKFTEIAQLVPGAALVPPVRPMEVLPAAPPVIVPPQVLVTPGVPATTRPDGNASLTARPVRATVLAAGFVIVRVKTELALATTLVGANALLIVGGATTVKVAEAVPPVPLVALTLPVVLTLLPAVAAVTLTETAQVALTASEPPLRLNEVEPEVAPLTDPPQLLLRFGIEATCKPAVARLSVTATLVCVIVADGFVMVSVTVELAPSAMVVGENALVIVGTGLFTTWPPLSVPELLPKRDPGPGMEVAGEIVIFVASFVDQVTAPAVVLVRKTSPLTGAFATAVTAGSLPVQAALATKHVPATAFDRFDACVVNVVFRATQR
jgi:hypothetical protein